MKLLKKVLFILICILGFVSFCLEMVKIYFESILYGNYSERAFYDSANETSLLMEAQHCRDVAERIREFFDPIFFAFLFAILALIVVFIIDFLMKKHSKKNNE